MNTYSITNITPVPNGSGNLTQLTFIYDIIDETSAAVSRNIVVNYSVALNEVNSYSTSDLMLLAQADVDAQTYKSDMENYLQNKKTPVRDPLEPQPAAQIQALATEPEQRALMIETIDNLIAQTYDRFQRFTMEYVAREKAAQDFKAAGYTGDPTVWITHVAENLGLTNQETADLVITQANAMRAALILLGQLRMDKYKVANAPTIEDANNMYFEIIDKRNTIDKSLT
jgi:hypothetical protein